MCTFTTSILLLYPVHLLWRQILYHHDLYLPVEDWCTYLSPLGLWGRGNHHTLSTDSTSKKTSLFFSNVSKTKFLQFPRIITTIWNSTQLRQYWNLSCTVFHWLLYCDVLQWMLNTFICLRLSLITVLWCFVVDAYSFICLCLSLITVLW
jgi:hypothetical protein